MKQSPSRLVVLLAAASLTFTLTQPDLEAGRGSKSGGGLKVTFKKGTKPGAPGVGTPKPGPSKPGASKTKPPGAGNPKPGPKPPKAGPKPPKAGPKPPKAGPKPPKAGPKPPKAGPKPPNGGPKLPPPPQGPPPVPPSGAGSSKSHPVTAKVMNHKELNRIVDSVVKTRMSKAEKGFFTDPVLQSMLAECFAKVKVGPNAGGKEGIKAQQKQIMKEVRKEYRNVVRNQVRSGIDDYIKMGKVSANGGTSKYDNMFLDGVFTKASTRDKVLSLVKPEMMRHKVEGAKPKEGNDARVVGGILQGLGALPKKG